MKTMKTASGSSSGRGTPGMSATARPAATRSAGSGSLRVRERTSSPAVTARSTRTSSITGIDEDVYHGGGSSWNVRRDQVSRHLLAPRSERPPREPAVPRGHDVRHRVGLGKPEGYGLRDPRPLLR